MSTGSRKGQAILCACRGGRGPKGRDRESDETVERAETTQEQQTENDTGSRWINTDVFTHTNTETSGEKEKKKNEGTRGRGEKKRKLEKNAEARQLSK